MAGWEFMDGRWMGDVNPGNVGHTRSAADSSMPSAISGVFATAGPPRVA